MLYDIIHGFGGHYKCRRRCPGHGGGGGGTNPAWHHLQAQPGAMGGAADVGGHPIRHLDTQPSQELQYIQLFIMLLYRIA